MSAPSPEVRRRYDRSPKGRAAQARYRQTEKRRASQKRYYDSGKGKATIKRYQATPKGQESLLRGVHKRRAKMHEALSTLTAAEWEQIKTKHGQACVYCGKTGIPLTRDHVIPLSKGGHHVRENVVPACRSCNSRKNNRVEI